MTSARMNPGEYLLPCLTRLCLVVLCTTSLMTVTTSTDLYVVEGTQANVIINDLRVGYPTEYVIFGDVVGGNYGRVFQEHFIRNAGRITTKKNISRDVIASELNIAHLPVVFEIRYYVLNDQFQEVGSANVTLMVLDLDNHDPRFVGYENSTYQIMISEGQSGYELLPLVVDEDEGENSTQNYTLIVPPAYGSLFTLDIRRRTTGIVSEVRLLQSGSLDREVQSNYMVQVVATEGNENPQSATLTVNITVLDICDESPMFPNSKFYATIQENSPSGTMVLSNLTATDRDSLDEGNIRYRINLVCSSQYEDSPCFPVTNSPFQLDRETGDLTIMTNDVDREEFAEYQVTVVAEDTCMRGTTATVVVTVVNVNDNPPILTPLGSSNVSETQSVNSTIFFLNVRDDDYGRNRGSPLFSITLHENSTGTLLDTNVFFLYSNNDRLELRLGQALDREVTSGYSLVINTTDWGTPNISTINHFLITVVDFNDNSPIFQPVQSLYSVNEELTVSTVITTVRAIDRDSVESGNGEVLYSLPPDNGSFPYQDYLAVGPGGQLSVAQRIDREQQATFYVLVRAQDNPTRGVPLTDSVVINIELNDINDNRPTILTPQETVSITESQPPGSVVFEVSAYDNDTEPFSTIRYSLTPASVPFEINPVSGNVTLTASLDYETETNYSVEIRASDGELERIMSVTILVENINDERCIFNDLATYHTSVHENAARNFRVFSIDVTDRDTPTNELTFSIVDGNDRNHFTINQMSGQVFTTQSLDNEMVSNYSLRIQCSDGSDLPTTKSIYIDVIDINEHPPQFVNTPYTFAVSENLPSETPVGTVHAEDPDSSTSSTIIYELVRAAPSAALYWFILDSSTGRIMTNRTLDREDTALEGMNGSVMLNVQATDMLADSVGLSSNSIVSILITDRNDHRPVFEQSILTITLQENFVVGNDLPERVVATDRDSPPNNDINYEISGSTPTTFFRVGRKNGVIILLDPLDFETRARHEFIVLAIDSNMMNLQDSLTVVVDVTDVPEVNIKLVDFNPSAQVQENSPINHRVIQFGVTDNDGAPILRNIEVTYTIMNENGIGQENDFGLMNDTHNSMLIVYVKNNIDRESLPEGSNGVVQRVLNITVRSNTHGSVSAILTVTIQDQNDNRPVFSMPSYTFEVFENNDASVPIGSVSAMDTDFGVNGSAGISFQVADSTAFQVTADGELRSIQSLDRESHSSHNFFVIASDGASPPMTSRVAVQVIVGDRNDNQPVFSQSQNRTFYVGEETRVNTVVATLRVSDLDSGIFGQVNVSIGAVPSQYFFIKNDGSIMLTGTLDREDTSSHFFTVMATDGGGESTTGDVTVIVEDYNDNMPIFNPIPTIVLNEDQEENVVFQTVSATDEDIGYNGMVMYAIGNYSLSRTFCINPSTGELKLCLQHISCQNEDITNFERESMYSVDIVAYDLGSPRHIVTKTITIIIQSVNEHPPLFDRELLFVYVDETRDSDVEVARISAVDQDKGDHITYVVLEGNQQSDLFRYDQARGAIINNGHLDYSTQPVHEVTLRATDSGSKMDHVVVLIYVNNINDHPPVFHPDSQPNAMSQPLVIKESTSVSTVVWTVRASDEDNATYDAVSYYIAGEDSDLRFMIDSLTGEISINESLDYEQRESYTLRIYARDNGSPQMTSSSPVSIWISIQNENDEIPIFNSTSYTFSVAENEPAMTVVGRVYAPDRDSGDYGVVYYSISQGINEYFDIDPMNGNIFTLREIDRDVLASDVVSFTVHASDGAPGLETNTAVANVEIIIADLNDNAPELTAAQYLISISPNQVPFIPIPTSISASDRDEGNNAQYHYEIVTEGSSSNLAINVSSTTGQLILSEPIPSNYQLAYIYDLRAVDSRDSNLFSTAHLELLVETDNDHHPRFNRVMPSKDVSELSPNGTEVFVVNSVVTDADDGDNGRLSYTFAQPYPKFAIDLESGRISLREMLDFETVKIYNLAVQAMDSRAGVRRTATGVVQVRVLPGNEFEPRFDNLPSEFTFSYLPEVGLELFNVTATDQDEGTGGQVNYNIIDPNHFFAIDTRLGVVRNQGPLESDMQFNVMIEAYDLGNPFRSANTTIRIIIRNAGSSTPRFVGLNPRPITKPEDITMGSLINTALITNPSAQSYHLVKQTVFGGSTPINKFSITEGQGRLSVIESLDYEEVNMYSFVVEARVTTTGSTSEQRASDFLQVTLTVTNVNDNEPVFTVMDNQVFAENTPVRTSLFRVEADDRDLGQEGSISYDIIQGDSERTFSINSSTGHVQLIRPLDREVVSSYNLLIQAQDLSNQPRSAQITIRVTVTDINDYVTTYGGRNYSLDVYESPSTNAGDRIIKLSATDLDENPRLRYSMDMIEASQGGVSVQNLPRSSFNIDPLSGTITVDALTLDRESVDYYLFRVTATDNINMAETYLTIRILDVNDHVPEVTVPDSRLRVLEGMPSGVVVTEAINVADEDVGINRWVKYSLGHGWPENYFRIDPLSGVIRTNNVIIARSDILNFQGEVIVKDQGINPRRAVALIYITIVDVNNHAPMFESGSITLTISVTTTPGSKLHKFNVTDEDLTVNASPLMFHIPTYYEDAIENFMIDAGDGTLALRRPQTELRSFSFRVDVSNPAFTPKCVHYMQASSINITVQITPVNTGCPVFSQTQYTTTSVAEGEPDQNFPLLRITANDPDGDSVTYSIVQSTDLFSIHPMTGNLTGTGSLDRETQDSYQLTILATDSGYPTLSCSIDITVTVTDVNDNRPVFTRNAYTDSLRENSPANTSVTSVVSARDDDLGSNGSISYYLTPSKLPFRIDSTTGEIFVSSLLDYEASPDYTFHAVALDGGSPPSSSSALITISLIDVNEGPPTFIDVSNDPIVVNANMVKGTVVYTVRGTDPDTRTQLIYSFVNPEPKCYFDLNNRTGEITLKVNPNSENTCSSQTTAVRSTSDPSFFVVEAMIRVTDGELSRTTTVDFSLHGSFGTPVVPTPQSIPIEIITASVTGFLLVVLIFVVVLIVACICRSKRSKIVINDTTHQSIELRKKFGSTRSSSSNNTMSLNVYKQTTMGSLPLEHTTMSVAAHSGGSGASSTRQSYVCNGDSESGGGGGGIGMHDRATYPSPGTVSSKSQLSKPYRSTSDLGSTMATDMLSNGSQETAPYPKSQIERIYAKNADLLDGSNESIHMFGSEGGGESDGGDVLYGKFNDLDDDDDSTTMQDDDDDDDLDDDDDRGYRRRSIPSSRENLSLSIPPVEDPYTPYNHTPAMTNWVPRANNMAETIDQIAYESEEHMRRGQHFMVDEFGKSQGGMSGYGGGTQESTRPLLRHTHHHSHHLHPQELPPPQQQPRHMMQQQQPEFYYDDVGQDVRLHEHHMMRGVPPKYSGSSTGLPSYQPHDIPRHLPMGRHPGGGVGGVGGSASQEVPPMMGGYGYHGDFMHHPMHHEMGAGTHSPSSTPTEEALNTRALTNEYESDIMYSSDTSINTNTESDQPPQQKQLQQHHPHQMRGPPRGFSQSGSSQRGFSQPGSSQRGFKSAQL